MGTHGNDSVPDQIEAELRRKKQIKEKEEEKGLLTKDWVPAHILGWKGKR